MILIGASQGHINPWMPLSTITRTEPMVTVRSLDELQPLLLAAKNKQQPVLIDFYADWCRSCKIIEEELATDTGVQTALSSFQVIRADITEDNSDTRALSQYYHVVAPPTFIFIAKDGTELTQLMHTGEISMDILESLLKNSSEVKDEPSF